jgi:hypothetical protein
MAVRNQRLGECMVLLYDDIGLYAYTVLVGNGVVVITVIVGQTAGQSCCQCC